MFLFVRFISVFIVFHSLVTAPLHQNWLTKDMQGVNDILATSSQPGTACDSAFADSFPLVNRSSVRRARGREEREGSPRPRSSLNHLSRAFAYRRRRPNPRGREAALGSRPCDAVSCFPLPFCIGRVRVLPVRWTPPTEGGSGSTAAADQPKPG